jgi:hypothetical protein
MYTGNVRANLSCMKHIVKYIIMRSFVSLRPVASHTPAKRFIVSDTSEGNSVLVTVRHFPGRARLYPSTASGNHSSPPPVA